MADPKETLEGGRTFSFSSGATSRAKASRCERTPCVESSTAAWASDFFLKNWQVFQGKKVDYWKKMHQLQTND